MRGASRCSEVRANPGRNVGCVDGKKLGGSEHSHGDGQSAASADPNREPEAAESTQRRDGPVEVLSSERGKDTELELILEFDRMARSAASVQLELLSSIISTNAGSEYLQRYSLESTSNVAAFKSCIPVVEYEDVEPLIQRIANGDTSPILCCEPVTGIILSSGTSAGKPKMIPITQSSRQVTSQRFVLSNALLKREFFPDPEGKALCFIYAGKLVTTRGGLKAGSASTLHLRSAAPLDTLFKTLPNWTSPMGVVLGSNFSQSMYCHLLCGLLQANEVTTISSFLAYGVCEAFRMFETAWQELCTDIRSGTLSGRVKDESVRRDVLKLLHPNPQLADKIQSECATNRWAGIIGRLWPNLKYVHTIVTGAMEPYVPYLKHYAGDIPLVCGDHGSSECTIGINLNVRCPPEHVSFTLVPHAAYFEFLPLNHEQGVGPLDITSISVGEEYELIVTTVAGLYRYRLGDVVEITGFYHASPQYKFVRRKNVILSINTDKTDERELYIVITQACTMLREESLELLDYTSYADHSSRPGHYTIFLELKDSTHIQDSLLEQCCDTLDSSFNDPYQRGRVAGTIGPLELCIVKEGTFFRIMQFSVEAGASPTQYKTPRWINSADVLNILRGSVIRTYCKLTIN